MKIDISKLSRQPRNRNAPKDDSSAASSTSTSEAEATSSSDPDNNDTPTPVVSALADLAGAFRDAVRDITRTAEELTASSHEPDTGLSGNLEEVLREGLARSIDCYIEEWKSRLNEQTAQRIADVLVFNAAAILGRCIADNERSSSGTSEFDHACAFLDRVAVFAELFGAPEMWNSLAARRFAVERLAGPLGIVERDESGALLMVLDGMKELLMEWISRSWRDLVGAILEVPIHIPAPPDASLRWSQMLDRQALAHAIERAVTDGGLVRLCEEREVVRSVVTHHASWLLTRDIANEQSLEPSASIEHIATDAVIEALQRPESASIDTWTREALGCPAPVRALLLPAGHGPTTPLEADMALLPAPGHDGSHDRSGDDVLMVTSKMRNGWGLWCIPGERITPERDEEPWQLSEEPAGQPSGVTMCRSASRLGFIAGDCRQPLLFQHGEAARIVRAVLRPASDAGEVAREASNLALETVLDIGDEIGALDARHIDGVYSLPDGKHPESFLLITWADKLMLYRSDTAGLAWWHCGSPVLVASLWLMGNASVFGVAGDQLIFRIADGFWAFFPVQALLAHAPEPFATLRTAARGILFRDPAALGEELLAPPEWIRMGRLQAVACDEHGTTSVAFADLAWIDVYERGDGVLPRRAASVEVTRTSHAGRLSHIRWHDGQYLVLRSTSDQLEFHMAPRQASPHGHGRIL